MELDEEIKRAQLKKVDYEIEKIKAEIEKIKKDTRYRLLAPILTASISAVATIVVAIITYLAK